MGRASGVSAPAYRSKSSDKSHKHINKIPLRWGIPIPSGANLRAEVIGVSTLLTCVYLPIAIGLFLSNG